MRKYYLFNIKEEYIEFYKNNRTALFFSIESIYKLNGDNYKYGINIFNQLCNVFDVSIINNYFNNRNKKYIKKYNNKYYINDYKLKERTCIQINYSCIVIKTNCNYPEVLKIFSIYNDNIFVCDFENIDYFWLSDNKKKVYN